MESRPPLGWGWVNPFLPYSEQFKGTDLRPRPRNDSALDESSLSVKLSLLWQ